MKDTPEDTLVDTHKQNQQKSHKKGITNVAHF
jgi:hypothetical protein